MSDTSLAVRQLQELAPGYGVTIEAALADRFGVYLDLLLFWGARISLTGARTARALVTEHLLDALPVVPAVTGARRLADLGSGAGFPGVPLALLCPETAVVLVESRRKRANFLREVVRQIRLTNATVYEGRAEELARQEAGGFDRVTCRALASLPAFLELAAPLLQPGGVALALKGPAVAEETDGPFPGFGPLTLDTWVLPGGARHCLVRLPRQLEDPPRFT